MIDMRVGDNDLFYLQIVFADESENTFNVVPGIDDHRFVRGFVADDRAIALQWSHRNNFVDHASIVRGGLLKNGSTCRLSGIRSTIHAACLGRIEWRNTVNTGIRIAIATTSERERASGLAQVVRLRKETTHLGRAR